MGVDHVISEPYCRQEARLDAKKRRSVTIHRVPYSHLLPTTHRNFTFFVLRLDVLSCVANCIIMVAPIVMRTLRKRKEKEPQALAAPDSDVEDKGDAESTSDSDWSDYYEEKSKRNKRKVGGRKDLKERGPKLPTKASISVLAEISEPWGKGEGGRLIALPTGVGI